MTVHGLKTKAVKGSFPSGFRGYGKTPPSVGDKSITLSLHGRPGRQLIGLSWRQYAIIVDSKGGQPGRSDPHGKRT